jgi:hypothetical protein
MTPTLSGRLQTRGFLAATVGVTWTAAVTPVLPRAAGIGIADAYRTTFSSLLAMTLLGLLWEGVYHLVQQARWDKDWPSLLALATVLNESAVLWLVLHAVGVVPGSLGAGSPFFPAFAVHLGTTWLVMWLFLQGPIRVLHPRWRFQGGELFGVADALTVEEAAPRPAVGTSQRAYVIQPADRFAEDRLVTGVTCRHGHFGYGGTSFCTVCGTALTPAAGSTALGPRPPLGVLILPDGSTRLLDVDLRILRTSAGELDIVPWKEEPAGTQLAEIRLIAWRPAIIGPSTSIAVDLPGGTRLRTEPDVPIPLVPGAELRFGHQTVRFESLYQAYDPAERQTSPEPARTSRRRFRRPKPAASVRAPQTAVATAAAIVLAATAAAALAAGITVVATSLPVP